MNPHIDTAYWWLTAATVPIWVCALYWNWQATHRGVTEAVRMRAATTVLAAIYLAATLLLLFAPIDTGQWSDMLRGLQLLSVPIVWTQPARFSVKMADRIREADQRARERLNGEP